MRRLFDFILGGLLVAVVVLSIHDRDNIATLKSMHKRLKDLEIQVSECASRFRCEVYTSDQPVWMAAHTLTRQPMPIRLAALHPAGYVHAH